MEPFIGMIVMFGGNFAPRGWALCDGSLLSISQNSALFSILGTTYGGDGRTTFALPDLRGRLAMHAGSGPGLTPRSLGQKGGVENVTLTTNNLPSHTHTASAVSTANSFNAAGASTAAQGNFWADSAEGDAIYNAATNANMNAGAVTTNVTVDPTGAGAGIGIVSPFQCVNFIIALTGTYPSRN